MRLPAILALPALLGLAASRLVAGGDLELTTGRAFWRPGGAGKLRPVPARLQLEDGDWVQVDPGAAASLRLGSAPPMALPAPGTYRLRAGTLEAEGREGWAPAAGAPAPTGPAPDRAPAPPASDLFATLRPVGGLVHMRRGDEGPWIEVRGLTSIPPGTWIEVSPIARAEVVCRDDHLTRAGPGALFVVGRRRVEVRAGRVAAQVEDAGSSFELVTAEALVRGGHGLLVAEHHPSTGTTVFGHRGLWRVENRPPHEGEQASLYLPPGKHTALASCRDAPRPPLRFDVEAGMAFFTENWNQDRPPPPDPIPEGPEDEAARRQLRQDQVQAPPEEPAPTYRDRTAKPSSGRPELEARERKNWLRLRVLAGRAPRMRRHYLAFRHHYADDRKHALPPGEEDRPIGITEGASKQAREEQEAWTVARHSQNLRREEVELHQDDLARRDLRHLERERFVREAREELFGYEPLKYQTRSMILPTRARVDQLVAGAQELDLQAKALDLGGQAALAAQRRAQRDNLLLEADRRKDQLEELIRMH